MLCTADWLGELCKQEVKTKNNLRLKQMNIIFIHVKKRILLVFFERFQNRGNCLKIILWLVAVNG